MSVEELLDANALPAQTTTALRDRYLPSWMRDGPRWGVRSGESHTTPRRATWRPVGRVVGQVGVLLAQGSEARLEGGHAFLESGRVEVACFQGGVVAVECAFGATRLVGQRATLFQLNDGRLPASWWRWCLFVGKLARNRGGAEPSGRVELEDALHRRRGPFVRDHFLLLVAPGAERQPSGRPLAFFARRSIPAVTRSTIVACSNSANTPSICSIIRPAAALVSNGSVAERSTTPSRLSSSASWASWLIL